MALLAARRPDLPLPSRAERDRIRELSKYYCTFRNFDVNNPSPTPAAPVDDEQPDTAYLSPDITLNALGQLGVYRFGCDRSFISIIDGQSQHILAETTASISLRHKDQHLPNNGIYLGFRTLNLEWGVCPHTIKLFTAQDISLELNTPNITADRTRYIIRNFAAEECFKNRPYVVDWPHMRFYAEVPLFSASGHVLGSYCVVDDKPRDVFGDHEVALLQEIADAIAHHLENARIVHFHRRAEKLVKGVADFVTDHPNPDAELKKPTATFSGLPLHTQSANDGESGLSPSMQAARVLESTTIAEEISALSFSTERSDQTRITSVPSSFEGQIAAMTPLNENHTTRDRVSSHFRTSRIKPGVAISQSIASIFSHASAILRDSMDLAGVMFLDAYQSNSGVKPFQHNGRSSEVSESLCESFGHALGISEHRSPDDSGVAVTEKLLRIMIDAYPEGQIFNMSDQFEDNEPAELEASNDITQTLAAQFPDADSVLFLPLWDWNKSRWLAGTLVWTKLPQRALGSEELGFFKAFGNSIISEVARVNWDAIEKSKSDFISSISHELRSPLHGVLGNTELLRATALEPVQVDMVKLIESCGLTLLDVLDHLLDFTKINSIQREDSLMADMTTLMTDVDLGILIEDVTGIMYSSQTTGDRQSFQSNVEGLLTPAIPSTNARDMENLNVVIRIEEKTPWKVRTVAGAWRRILMSLVGNSMKWTRKGVIEVSLSNISPNSDSEPVLAHLSVTDTGRGISPEYLRHSVFSPFSQEESLSEGIGLGLSLVHKLVTFLGGHIDVESEMGMGTQIDIYIPVQSLTAESSESLDPYSKPAVPIPPTRVCLIGFEGYPDLQETPTGIQSTESKRKLSIQKAVGEVLLAQPNLSVSFSESVENAQGDFAVIEEAKLLQTLQDGSLFSVQTRFKSFLVLGEKLSIAEGNFKANLVRVSQPYGPQKLRKAVNSILADLELSETHQDPYPKCDTAFVQEALQSNDHDARRNTRPKSGMSNTAAQTPAPTLPVTLEPPIIDDRAHVLIVDDNDINLKILTTFVQKLGCSYESATNGLIALGRYKESKHRINYVLMDLSMPVMDGLTATTKIREYEKENNIPEACIMAVTGVASAEMQQQAQLAGIDDYVVKPVSLQTLRKMMNIS